MMEEEKRAAQLALAQKLTALLAEAQAAGLINEAYIFSVVIAQITIGGTSQLAVHLMKREPA